MTNTLLYAAAVLIWGSTWFAMEFQLGVVPVEVSLVYRYASAAALLFGWCLLRGHRLRFDLRDHGWFALLGLFLFGLNYVFAYRAQEFLTSALNAIVFTSMLWLNIINARVFLGTRIEPRVWVGAGAGMLGIGTLFWPQLRDLGVTHATLVGLALAFGGALVASFGNIISQSAQQSRSLPVRASNAWGMLYGAVLLTVFALASGAEFTFDPSTGYVVSLAYLTVFGSVVAFGCYLTLLGRIGAHRAGYVVVMFPVVALTLSGLFEGLVFDGHIVVGVVLTLGGNLLILSRLSLGRWLRRPATRSGNSAPEKTPA